MSDFQKIDFDDYNSLCNKEAFLECLFTSSKTATGTNIPFETVRKNAMKLYAEEYGENFTENI